MTEKLRASEALLLGSTIVPGARGTFGRLAGEPGCAIGMICEAMHAERTQQAVERLYPWMCRYVAIPCGCQEKRSVVKISNILMHLFDSHSAFPYANAALSVTDGDWTLERIAAWLDEAEAASAEQPIPGATRAPREPVPFDEYKCSEQFREFVEAALAFSDALRGLSDSTPFLEYDAAEEEDADAARTLTAKTDTAADCCEGIPALGR